MEDYMPKVKVVSAPADKILQTVKETMEKYFPGYSSFKKNSDEQLRDKLKKEGAFKK
jgi:hypothetical protein